jgi:hypothetical protein
MLTGDSMNNHIRNNIILMDIIFRCLLRWVLLMRTNCTIRLKWREMARRFYVYNNPAFIIGRTEFDVQELVACGMPNRGGPPAPSSLLIDWSKFQFDGTVIKCHSPWYGERRFSDIVCSVEATEREFNAMVFMDSVDFVIAKPINTKTHALLPGYPLPEFHYMFKSDSGLFAILHAVHSGYNPIYTVGIDWIEGIRGSDCANVQRKRCKLSAGAGKVGFATPGVPMNPALIIGRTRFDVEQCARYGMKQQHSPPAPSTEIVDWDQFAFDGTVIKCHTPWFGADRYADIYCSLEKTIRETTALEEGIGTPVLITCSPAKPHVRIAGYDGKRSHAVVKGNSGLFALLYALQNGYNPIYTVGLDFSQDTRAGDPGLRIEAVKMLCEDFPGAQVYREHWLSAMPVPVKSVLPHLS